MTKEGLKEYILIKKEIVQLEELIMKLNEQKTSIKSQVITDMPVGSGEGREILDILVSIEEAIDKLNKNRVKLVSTLMEIENLIEGLDATERVLMRYRYINDLKWEQIALNMNYSWRQVHRIHNEILKKIA